jgi:predicted small integral membrane protein
MYLVAAIYLVVGLVVMMATSKKPAAEIESNKTFHLASALVTLTWPVFLLSMYLQWREDNRKKD